MDVRGIQQSDVLVRRGLLAGLQELRDHPELLDFCFQPFLQDDLSSPDYGPRAVQAAKEWFSGNDQGKPAVDIRVVTMPTLGDIKLPCITVDWLDSSEIENTLGDVHYEVTEAAGDQRPAIAGPLNPLAWDPVLGALTLPLDVTTPITTDMFVRDARGVDHVILQVNDATAPTLLLLEPGTVADFQGMTVRPPPPGEFRQLEGAAFRETYRIGCHVSGEPAFLRYLSAILLFVLLRGRQALFEGRGLERSYVQQGPIERYEGVDSAENVWSRYFVLAGEVRQVWPKGTFGRIWGVEGRLNMSPAGSSAGSFEGGTATPADEGFWSADPLTVKLLR